MSRLLMVGLLSLAVAACGGGGDNNGIVVGDNSKTPNNTNQKNNDNNVADAGNNTVRDMNQPPDEDTGNNNDNNMPDMAPPEDMATPDMNMSEEDMSMPDMNVEEDMAMPDMGMDMEVDMNMPNCPPNNFSYGQACACDNECVSGLCLGETPTSMGVCSKTCTTRADCPFGQDACLPDPDNAAQTVCREDDTGDSCDAGGGVADPAACAQELCVQSGGSNFADRYFCSVPCDSSSDCASGQACSPILCTTIAGGRSCIPSIVAMRSGSQETALLGIYDEPFTACVPTGATIDPGCSVNVGNEQACPSGIGDCSADRCTTECSDTNDCPVGGCVPFSRANPDSTLNIMVCEFP